MVDEDDVANLVADRPELASSLESVLAVDEERERWAFDDVPVDTGVFGEIVGQGLVDEDDDGYYVVDPAIVRAGIAAAERPTPQSDDESETGGEATRETRTAAEAGEAGETTGAVSSIARAISTVTGSEREFAPSTVPVRRALAMLAVFALFVAARISNRGSVFRDGDAVLMGNDPYYYRYWVETLLAESSGPLDLGVLADAPTGEPLLVATLWWVSSLLGGTADAAGFVLAWYPVVAGLVVAGLLYLLATRVFGDHRVGLIAVTVLAVIPGHAMRTALGFADHHAFDYVWLMGTIVALAWLATVDADAAGDGSLLDRIPWPGAIALGVAVAGLVLAWNGSPVVLAPVALLLALRTLLAVDADRSPVVANVSVLAGLALAAVLSLVAHFAFGWQVPAVVLVPGLLCVGGVAVVALGVFARRRDLSIRAHAGLQVVSAAAGFGVLSVAVPAAVSQLRSRLTFLVAPRNIGETVSLFDPSRTFGVDLVGLVVLFALPMLVVGLWRGVRGETPWLVVSVFGWWFLFLSALQLRFVGQLAPLVALFAGFGVIAVFDRLGLAPGTPTLATVADDSDSDDGTGAVDSNLGWFDRTELTVRSGATVVVLLGLLVGPAAWGVSDTVSSPAVEDRVYETATWIAEDADRRGLSESDRYVFSSWGDNRIYNYYVSGEAQSYAYAQDNYLEFLDSDDPAIWYDRLENRTDSATAIGNATETWNGTGYVVFEPLKRYPGTLFHHLWTTYGSRWSERGYDAVSHYRMVYVTENYRNRVFVLVPGAPITGDAEPGTTVEVKTEVEVPNTGFDYRAQATAGPDGRYSLVVPYPGEYELTIGNETATVSVPESAVRNGTGVSVGDP